MITICGSIKGTMCLRASPLPLPVSPVSLLCQHCHRFRVSRQRVADSGPKEKTRGEQIMGDSLVLFVCFLNSV